MPTNTEGETYHLALFTRYTSINNETMSIYFLPIDKNAEILKRTCCYNLESNNYDKAKENLAHYIYSALSQIDYKSTLRKMPYYSFRTFSDCSLKDVKEQKLTLSHPREFNDPLDTLLVWWMESEIAESHGSELDKKYTLLLKKVSEGIKIRCLSAGKTTTSNGYVVSPTCPKIISPS